MIICIHTGQNTVIRMTVTRMIILIAHLCPHVKTLKDACINEYILIYVAIVCPLLLYGGTR